MRYKKETLGIVIEVEPRFSLSQSDPGQGVFVFTYSVRIGNSGGDVIQLLFRHWDIHDANGEDTVVDGDGVIGLQPVLGPGESHSYSSFCVLGSPAGHMKGHYTFQSSDGSRFKAEIPRFALEAPMASTDSDDGSALLN